MNKPVYEIHTLACLCHQVNRAYCQTIGDKSQHDWDFISQSQRDSVVDGVTAFLENPKITPEQMHKNWLAFKEKNGWKYGPVKDETKKEHPCMVEFERLPVEQRMKDYLFLAVCNAYVQGVNAVQ